MQKLRRLLPLAALGILALVVAAGCGGGGSKSSTSGGASTNTNGKTGGTVTILDTAGSVDSLDPGYWYYQTDYEELGTTTQRWLYSWKPDSNTPTPDVAQGLPQVSDGGKTLTIKIKPGIKYSAPLANRTVTSKDVKYAMSRCFLPQVGNGYALVYWGDIEGAQAYSQGKATEVTGLQTPDDNTLVIKLTKPVGVLATGAALGLPCTAPVPQDYAEKYDKGKTSTYGEHQVFTGPYMIEGAGSGTVPQSGYQPGKLISLVRNPSWDKSTDFKPAYFDKIIIKNGGDVSVTSRQVLAGQSMMSGDSAVPPPAVLKEGLTTKKSQFQISPSGGNRYIALNTKVKPLDNVNFRRAIAAVVNRDALRQTRGGPAVGTVATHFIPPDIPGFDQAGGNAGPGYDFYKNPSGDVALAKEYMKKAGYPSGMYSGPPLLTIADNQSPAKETAEAFQQQLSQIGIKLQLREIPHASVIGKFCGTPKQNVAICPTLGWGKDFFDAQSMVDPIFNGKNITQSGNVNTAQANDPKFNAQMDKAEELTDPTQRAQTWGQLDKDLTGQVFYVVWLWDNEVNFTSTNVKGVQNSFNGNAWDLTYSSLT
jgi:peptide/nickel transport system substrate-binding protein